MSVIGRALGFMGGVPGLSSFSTWNPSDKGAAVTLSNGDKTMALTSNNDCVRGTDGKTSGKWYWEITVDSFSGASGPGIGVANGSAGLTASFAVANAWCYYSQNGNKYDEGSGSAYGATFTSGAVIGVALDVDAGTVEFFKNGSSQGVWTPGLTGTIYPFVGGDSVINLQLTANFGASAFAYSPPSGFTAGIGP